MILSSLIPPTTLTVDRRVLLVVLGGDLLELAQLTGAPTDPHRQRRGGRAAFAAGAVDVASSDTAAAATATSASAASRTTIVAMRFI